jgi:hypothetical protein
VRCFDLVWPALAPVAYVTLSSLHFPISRRSIFTFSLTGKISVLTGMRSQEDQYQTGHTEPNRDMQRVALLSLTSHYL